MNYKNAILNELLDKYERSKSVVSESNRRIILKVVNWNVYNIENYEEKNVFHDVVIQLKKANLIDYSWKEYEKRKYFKRNMA